MVVLRRERSPLTTEQVSSEGQTTIIIQPGEIKMELKIIDKTDDEMHLEIIGENHTLLNMLKSALLDDQRVQIATYDMKHVSISDPILFVKTDGADPIAVVKDATNSLMTQCDEFMSIFREAIDV